MSHFYSPDYRVFDWRLQISVSHLVLAIVFLGFSIRESRAQEKLPISPRIVDGGAALPGAYPWYVSLEIALGAPEFLFHVCGGTLIASNRVLTAAHCTRLIDESTRAVVGLDQLNEGEGVSGVSAKILKVHVHPHYNADSLENDLAVLELDRSFSGPFLIPLTRAEGRYAAPGKPGLVVGFGLTDAITRHSPQILQSGKVRIHSSAQCRRGLGKRQDSDLYNYNHSIEMCANGASKKGLSVDGCFGDSGGALVVENPPGSFRLAGVTSYRNGRLTCGYPANPSAFVRVSAFSDWLKRILGDSMGGVSNYQIIGTKTLGSNVSCRGVSAGSAASLISWHLNGRKIVGASGPQLRLTRTMLGKYLSCAGSAASSAGKAVSSSAVFGPIVPRAFDPRDIPTVDFRGENCAQDSCSFSFMPRTFSHSTLRYAQITVRTPIVCESDDCALHQDWEEFGPTDSLPFTVYANREEESFQIKFRVVATDSFGRVSRLSLLRTVPGLFD